MNLQSMEAELLRLAECCLILTLLPPTDARRAGQLRQVPHTTPLSSLSLSFLLLLLLCLMLSSPYIVLEWTQQFYFTVISHLQLNTLLHCFLMYLIHVYCLPSLLIVYTPQTSRMFYFSYFSICIKVNRYFFWMALLLKCTQTSINE